jgi:hypothetical protein
MKIKLETAANSSVFNCQHLSEFVGVSQLKAGCVVIELVQVRSFHICRCLNFWGGGCTEMSEIAQGVNDQKFRDGNIVLKRLKSNRSMIKVTVGHVIGFLVFGIAWNLRK